MELDGIMWSEAAGEVEWAAAERVAWAAMSAVDLRPTSHLFLDLARSHVYSLIRAFGLGRAPL